jgi:hypothetical protein
MQLRRIWVLGLQVGAVAAVAIFCSFGAGQSVPVKLMPAALKHHPARLHHERAHGSWDSTNWSGYAVTGPNGTVTDAKASWTVPAVSCTGNTLGSTSGYSSFWVGIDGWSSNTVEQIGTDSDCISPQNQPNTPTYYGWFEFYPQPAYYIGDPSTNFSGATVQPGDVMSAEVKYTGYHRFNLTITNTSKGWVFTRTSSVRGARQSSAEWIAETPCCQSNNALLPLANFAFADYGYGFTGVLNTAFATVSGVTGPLGSFGNSVQEVTMISEGDPGGSPSGTVMAQPSSPLTNNANGSSFSVTWENAGP